MTSSSGSCSLGPLEVHFQSRWPPFLIFLKQLVEPCDVSGNDDLTPNKFMFHDNQGGKIRNDQ